MSSDSRGGGVPPDGFPPHGYGYPGGGGQYQPQPHQQPQQPVAPFIAAYDPAQHMAAPRRGVSLRPAQWAAIAGFVLLILGMVVGDIAGVILLVLGALGIVVGVVDAVRKVLAERGGHR